jgi:hypothetical protein
MKNFFGVIFLISLGASVFLLLVSVCNYLIAYQTAGERVVEAFMNNVYVRYWVNLLVFFIGAAVFSFLCFIVTGPSKVEKEAMQVYENRRVAGGGPVDNYVTVRVKRDDLSKLQG